MNLKELLQDALIAKIRDLPHDDLEKVREYIAEILALEAKAERDGTNHSAPGTPMKLHEPGEWTITHEWDDQTIVYRARCLAAFCEWRFHNGASRLDAKLAAMRHRRDAHPTRASALSTQHPELP